MRMSCIMCTLNLIILAIFGGVYAFSGFNLLLWLCMGNTIFMRNFLGIAFVSALFEVYALCMFKPFKGLK